MILGMRRDLPGGSSNGCDALDTLSLHDVVPLGPPGFCLIRCTIGLLTLQTVDGNFLPEERMQSEPCINATRASQFSSG